MNACLPAYNTRSAAAQKGQIRFFKVFYDNEQPGIQDLRATVIQRLPKASEKLFPTPRPEGRGPN
jgi:hypothetical protein